MHVVAYDNINIVEPGGLKMDIVVRAHTQVQRVASVDAAEGVDRALRLLAGWSIGLVSPGECQRGHDVHRSAPTGIIGACVADFARRSSRSACNCSINALAVPLVILGQSD